ncbi:MAG TPA: NAD-binding protein [Candidatus Obscuribacter sp.]|nr:potassium channel protein [Candidatus Obscuribacter sp.]MBK9279136.1 potassium channel protein [Candidatus Obscuribacter sp.]HMW91010.1 NAD-binding protein [Candidatus Obscuribacter sp.]HMX45605.1 NAD-binding protein [Candidatus Obscuribacter sp.]HNB16478.1 NAD-binding protein [Candidatus Obscuribacter sp.]
MKETLGKRFTIDLLRLTGFVLFGALGFMVVEGWDFLDALFMTVITLTTVGYGETNPLSTHGRIYTIFLILVGAGVVLYVLSDMVEIFLRLNIGARRMKQKIAKMSGHHIVCGYGRSGQEVIDHFLLNGISFVLIEIDPEKAKQAMENGLLVLCGDASSDDILMQAQIEKASGIVCALPDDSANTFIALSARGLNERIKIVCRAANPGSEAKMRRAGADMVISPYVICGKRMATAVTHPLVTEFLDVVMHTPGYDLRMEQVRLPGSSRLIGSTLKDANIKQASGAMILAVNQNGKLISNPSPELIFQAGDDLIALGTEQQLSKLVEFSGAKSSSR